MAYYDYLDPAVRKRLTEQWARYCQVNQRTLQRIPSFDEWMRLPNNGAEKVPDPPRDWATW